MQEAAAHLRSTTTRAALAGGMALILLAFLLSGCGGGPGPGDCGKGATTVNQGYDTASGQWSLEPRLPVPVGSSMAVGLGRDIYVLWGLDLLRFDTAAGTWEFRAPRPAGDSHRDIVPLGTELHVLLRPAPAGTELLVYDTIADSWAPGPGSSETHFTAVDLSGMIFATGGPTGSSELLDPTSGTWMPLAAAPSGEVESAETDGTEVFAFTRTGDLWIYDPTADAWSGGPGMPLGAGDVRTTIVGQDVYVAIRDGTHLLSLDVTGLDWTDLGPTPRKRSYASVASSGGIVYFIGGAFRRPC